MESAASQEQMKDMTQKQARAEAVRRWGPTATVTFRSFDPSKEHRGRLARYRCIVSNGEPRSSFVEGQGDTWQAAFADARPR
jgi:hypothetical protein